MFRVVIQTFKNKKSEKRTDVVMKTERMYELIGRFTFKYGTPTAVEEDDGVYEYEFLNEENNDSATISLGKITDQVKNKKESKSFRESNYRPTQPPTPPPPREPDDPILEEMLKAGVIELAPSYYNYSR